MANLKKKRTRIYPYQNNDLKDLPGEKWKEIPDFEGYYEISNFGRVKSLYRELLLSDGRTFRVTEKIKKVKMNTYINKTLNEPIYLLSVTLSKEGIDQGLSIGRLVYRLFVADFDIDDSTIWITYKDGDARNVHASNLLQTNISSKGLLSHQLGRRKNNFTEAKKAVTQFNSKGKLIKYYESLKDAAKETGYKPEFISKAARGIWNIYKSCFWRFGKHSKNLDLNKILSRDNGEAVNESLMKKLAIRKLDKKQMPAFLNLSVKSMKGEKWQHIPGLKGFYQVSSYGRIKCTPRFIHSNQPQLKLEKIIRPYLYLVYDKKRKKTPGGFLIHLKKNNKNYIFPIAKLVYCMFIKKIDLKKRGIKIRYKDKDPLNLHYKNLILNET